MVLRAIDQLHVARVAGSSTIRLCLSHENNDPKAVSAACQQ